MDFLEVSAKNVDDAITKACIELGLSSDQLEIQVISEGSSGFLGLGSKPAVIQVRKKEEAPAPVAEKEAEAVAEVTEAKAEKKAEEPVKAEPKKAAKKSEKKPEKKAEKKPEKSEQEKETPKVERTEEEIAAMKAAASKFLDGVFKAMELPVTISIAYDQKDDSLDVNFEGEDMGILIGKRGQTLDSLQYLVSLVVNKEQKNYVRVKLDTEDYRRRRRETLENLAKNIAYKVKRSRRPVSLEAMNPYERRIIHSALQGNKFVETHSEGNEPYRHVVVTLKKNSYEK